MSRIKFVIAITYFLFIFLLALVFDFHKAISEEKTEAISEVEQVEQYIKNWVKLKHYRAYKEAPEIAKEVIFFSNHFHIDKSFILATMQLESGFNSAVVGKLGEYGLMQTHGLASWHKPCVIYPYDSIQRQVCNGTATLAAAQKTCAEHKAQEKCTIAVYMSGKKSNYNKKFVAFRLNLVNKIRQLLENNNKE